MQTGCIFPRSGISSNIGIDTVVPNSEPPPFTNKPGLLWGGNKFCAVLFGANNPGGFCGPNKGCPVLLALKPPKPLEGLVAPKVLEVGGPPGVLRGALAPKRDPVLETGKEFEPRPKPDELFAGTVVGGPPGVLRGALVLKRDPVWETGAGFEPRLKPDELFAGTEFVEKKDPPLLFPAKGLVLGGGFELNGEEFVE